MIKQLMLVSILVRLHLVVGPSKIPSFNYPCKVLHSNMLSARRFEISSHSFTDYLQQSSTKDQWTGSFHFYICGSFELVKIPISDESSSVDH